ncbi:hypothetical protein C8R47DRAFT_1226090 [Mycena vitilis]|nr:hypothetical protein C8R47DRAFT_1226090 [Mycena vitilis]
MRLSCAPPFLSSAKLGYKNKRRLSRALAGYIPTNLPASYPPPAAPLARAPSDSHRSPTRPSIHLVTLRSDLHRVQASPRRSQAPLSECTTPLSVNEPATLLDDSRISYIPPLHDSTFTSPRANVYGDRHCTSSGPRHYCRHAGTSSGRPSTALGAPRFSLRLGLTGCTYPYARRAACRCMPRCRPQSAHPRPLDVPWDAPIPACPACCSTRPAAPSFFDPFRPSFRPSDTPLRYPVVFGGCNVPTAFGLAERGYVAVSGCSAEVESKRDVAALLASVSVLRPDADSVCAQVSVSSRPNPKFTRSRRVVVARKVVLEQRALAWCLYTLLTLLHAVL